MEVLARAIRQEKEIEGIQIGREEVEQFLFSDNLIIKEAIPLIKSKRIKYLKINLTKKGLYTKGYKMFLK